ncbi:hypothetical protein BH11GEM1_BH11GEM1_12210 [soil metagenome]
MRWILAVVVALLACTDAATDVATVCPSALRIGIIPRDTAIAVGGQFQIIVSLLGCGGTQVLSDSLTFTSSDPGVAVVGSRTGTVIGARPGTTHISVDGQRFHGLGAVSVSVR